MMKRNPFFLAKPSVEELPSEKPRHAAATDASAEARRRNPGLRFRRSMAFLAPFVLAYAAAGCTMGPFVRSRADVRAQVAQAGALCEDGNVAACYEQAQFWRGQATAAEDGTSCRPTRGYYLRDDPNLTRSENCPADPDWREEVDARLVESLRRFSDVTSASAARVSSGSLQDKEAAYAWCVKAPPHVLHGTACTSLANQLLGPIREQRRASRVAALLQRVSRNANRGAYANGLQPATLLSSTPFPWDPTWSTGNALAMEARSALDSWIESEHDLVEALRQYRDVLAAPMTLTEQGWAPSDADTIAFTVVRMRAEACQKLSFAELERASLARELPTSETRAAYHQCFWGGRAAELSGFLTSSDPRTTDPLRLIAQAEINVVEWQQRYKSDRAREAREREEAARASETRRQVNARARQMFNELVQHETAAREFRLHPTWMVVFGPVLRRYQRMSPWIQSDRAFFSTLASRGEVLGATFTRGPDLRWVESDAETVATTLLRERAEACRSVTSEEFELATSVGEAHTSPALVAFHVCFWGGSVRDWQGLLAAHPTVLERVQPLLDEISRAENNVIRWSDAREQRIREEQEAIQRREREERERQARIEEERATEAGRRRDQARRAERQQRVETCMSDCLARSSNRDLCQLNCNRD